MIDPTRSRRTERASRFRLHGRVTTMLAVGIWLLLGTLQFGCGGDDGGVIPDPPLTTAAQFTQRGWTHFEQDDLTAASEDFTKAIEIDSSYGPAYIGRGWTQLSRAISTTAMQNAVASFDDAISRSQTGAEVRSGRAAANLGAGGTSLAAAIADAQAARQASPSFVFTHRSSFDVDDLYLVEAFAYVAQTSFAEAIAAADNIDPSGIQAGNSASWTVDGTSYLSFESAVLAYLHKLSTDHAG